MTSSTESDYKTFCTEADPALLKIALTKSKPELLATALQVHFIWLSCVCISENISNFQEAEAAILAVALTKSRPDLLTVALQDATRENLKVALTSA